MDDLREAGEFSIDLYTMPDTLTTKLWDMFVSPYVRRSISVITLGREGEY